MNVKPLILDLIYPRRAVCMGCNSKLGCDRDDLCEDCRVRLAQGWIGPLLPARRLKLTGASYAHPYRGPAGSVVRNLKYRGVWILADTMGADIARAARQLFIGGSYHITAVPMHPVRLRQRGKNHAELLARSAAARLGHEYTELLYRTRNAPQQASLHGKARQTNLKDAFAVLPDRRAMVDGATILLIDDVCTTGATAQSCAKALRSAGARQVYLATYALGGEDAHE